MTGALDALSEGLKGFPGHPFLTKLFTSMTERRDKRVAEAIAAATAMLDSVGYISKISPSCN